MAPTSENGGDRAYEALEDVPDDSPDFAALSAVHAPSDSGGVVAGRDGGGPAVRLGGALCDGVRRVPHLGMGPLLIRGDEGLVEPEGLSVSGSLSVAARGATWCCLRPVDGSGKRVTRLWDAKTKKLVASLNGSAVTFWPDPRSPRPPW